MILHLGSLAIIISLIALSLCETVPKDLSVCECHCEDKVLSNTLPKVSFIPYSTTSKKCSMKVTAPPNAILTLAASSSLKGCDWNDPTSTTKDVLSIFDAKGDKIYESQDCKRPVPTSFLNGELLITLESADLGGNDKAYLVIEVDYIDPSSLNNTRQVLDSNNRYSYFSMTKVSKKFESHTFAVDPAIKGALPRLYATYDRAYSRFNNVLIVDGPFSLGAKFSQIYDIAQLGDPTHLPPFVGSSGVITIVNLHGATSTYDTVFVDYYDPKSDCLLNRLLVLATSTQSSSKDCAVTVFVPDTNPLFTGMELNVDSLNSNTAVISVHPEYDMNTEFYSFTSTTLPTWKSIQLYGLVFTISNPSQAEIKFRATKLINAINKPYLNMKDGDVVEGIFMSPFYPNGYHGTLKSQEIPSSANMYFNPPKGKGLKIEFTMTEGKNGGLSYVDLKLDWKLAKRVFGYNLTDGTVALKEEYKADNQIGFEYERKSDDHGFFMRYKVEVVNGSGSTSLMASVIFTCAYLLLLS
ncbi:hypothetical protein L596_020332 [Steinernema carpocapsae]|uniref:CUB-like domain-containing protein n=1 Tax=Steinernema carpocapsae TaxID=34508 RepID=A0A4U5MTD6_STECR|nr:hypothetical protein L596_020332 [Steinernema carpocapsae]